MNSAFSAEFSAEFDSVNATPNVYNQVRPTLQMVADLVRTRLVEEGGGQVPADTFTGDTYPNANQVERLIDQATVAIIVQIPGSLVEGYLPAAQHLAALYAAILVEGSYFREQLTDDQVELYRNLLTAGIRGLGATGGADTAASLRGGKVDSVLQRSVITDWDDPIYVYELGVPS